MKQKEISFERAKAMLPHLIKNWDNPNTSFLNKKVVSIN